MSAKPQMRQPRWGVHADREIRNLNLPVASELLAGGCIDTGTPERVAAVLAGGVPVASCAGVESLRTRGTTHFSCRQSQADRAVAQRYDENRVRGAPKTRLGERSHGISGIRRAALRLSA